MEWKKGKSEFLSRYQSNTPRIVFFTCERSFPDLQTPKVELTQREMLRRRYKHSLQFITLFITLLVVDRGDFTSLPLNLTDLLYFSIYISFMLYYDLPYEEFGSFH